MAKQSSTDFSNFYSVFSDTHTATYCEADVPPLTVDSAICKVEMSVAVTDGSATTLTAVGDSSKTLGTVTPGAAIQMAIQCTFIFDDATNGAHVFITTTQNGLAVDGKSIYVKDTSNDYTAGATTIRCDNATSASSYSVVYLSTS